MQFLKNYSILLLFPSVTSAYIYGDPTPAEQVHLEVINRARANPQAEADRLGIGLLAGVPAGKIDGNPQPPLTLNATLSEVARTHSQDMVARDYFSHFTPEGLKPSERITAAGYGYQAMGENIANLFNTETLEAVNSSLQMHDNLFIDEGIAGRGHRVNILSPDFKEVGIGLAGGQQTKSGTLFNTFYLTTDFATAKDDPHSFIVGVAYDDQNGDNFYTAGEGIAGVTVTVEGTGAQTVTASAGGYALYLAEGQYTLNFAHASKGQTTRTVTLSGDNTKVDVLATDFQPITPALSGTALTSDGQPVNTKATFNGGISVNGSPYQQQVMQQLTDTVEVRGQITVDPDHIGQQADILVCARVSFPADPTLYYFMLDASANVLAWDQQLSNLVVFVPNVTLTSTETVVMYSGQFSILGALNVYFGYRLQTGTIVFNAHSIDTTITE